MSSRFAAAVIQSAPVVFEPKATLAKIRDLTADASKQGAKLVVFPEAFVSAYPKGLDFGARVGSRTSKGRDDFRNYFDSAIDVPGRATQELSRAAKESGVYLVIGVTERDIGTRRIRSVAGPLFNEDAILLAEIDVGEVARGKYDFDVVGHYAGPDVFQLHVNEKPALPVIVD